MDLGGGGRRGTGQSGGRGGCSQDVLHEKRINKNALIYDFLLSFSIQVHKIVTILVFWAMATYICL